MKLIKSLILLTSVILGGYAFADNYKLDESHTHIGFKIRHLAFANVRGKFDKFQGTGKYDEKTGKLSDLKVTIQAESIDTNEPDRDKHLRSADFFDVAKFKELKFESTNIKFKGKKPSQITGKLTIHGITKSITLDVEEWGGKAEDAWGNQRIAFEATGKIDRRDFGLTWNKGLKKVAGLTVGNDVTFILEIQVIKVD
ncbi:MAG: polyisoprenoid-binding protein [Bdellovibrionales bacterium]|nr:polyisoprenoid-binding protein [Bdellovibrionales bacterium]